MMIPQLSRFKIIVLLTLLALIGLAASASAQSLRAGNFVVLQNPQMPVISTHFYIARVDDERTDKFLLGRLLQAVATPAKPAEPVKTELRDGSAAIKSFVANSFTTNKALRPLIVKIKSLSINEVAVPGGRAEGRVALSLQFGLLRDGDFIKLDDYAASSTYQRRAGPAQQVEPLLKNAVNNSLMYISKWMDNQADTNPNLARAVKVSFSNYKEPTEGDTIYYDINRPLKSTDFHAKPQGGKYAAEIYASLGYTEDVKLEKGIIKVKIALKVYLPKSASWARADAMNDYTLNHEQRHFDIVKIVAERFKQKIIKQQLTTYNYDGPINVAYLDALREIYELQKRYDGETAHGTDTYQQRLWSLRIEKELQQLNLKPLTAQAAEFN